METNFWHNNFNANVILFFYGKNINYIRITDILRNIEKLCQYVKMKCLPPLKPAPNDWRPALW